MQERCRKFTPEFRDEAVKMVVETSRPITEIARDIHVNEGPLGNWVNKYRAEHVDDEPALSVSQYTSQAFANKTAALGIRRSVGRTGVCFDNAQAESFDAAVKVERVNRTVYPTREHARKDVARYIEFRYNRKRLHSALGYQTQKKPTMSNLGRQTAA